MPGLWIFAIFLFVVAAIAVAAFFVVGDGKPIAAMVAAVFGALGLLCTIWSSIDYVSTRNVGILTSFGKPVGVHGAGMWPHAPWKQVHELSEAIQLQSFESNSYDDGSKGNASPGAGGPAINVRLANNSNAYVDINLNWRIREGAAPKMFQDYGGRDVFATIQQQLVDRQAQVMVSKVFATFNPQIVSTPVDPKTLPAAPAGQPAPPLPPPPPAGVTMAPSQGADLPRMADQVKADLQGAVGQEIEILDVRIPRLWYGPDTQSRIDQFNQNVQDTLNAAQKVKTAEQDALAAQARANQPPPNLDVAKFNCIMKAAENNRDAAGCWGQIGGNPLVQVPGH